MSGSAGGNGDGADDGAPAASAGAGSETGFEFQVGAGAEATLALPPAQGPRELYVYYRIRPGAEAAARAAVLDAQAALRHAHPGLATRLLRRADNEGDKADGAQQTWMETYARPSHRDGIDAVLEAAIERAAGAAVADHLTDGQRHVEAFHDDTPPAPA